MAKCKQCGTGGLFTKFGATGLCAQCLEKKLDEVQSSITPEIKEAADLGKLIEKEKSDLQKLKEKIAEAQKKAKQEEKKAKEANQRLIVAEEKLELESFSLYEPKFDFTNSEEYKARLDIQRKQKEIQGKRSYQATHREEK